jgi:hypothetical protein
MRNIGLKLSLLFLALSMTVGMTGVANATMEFADGRITLGGFFKNWTGYRYGAYGHERDSGLSIFRNTIQLELDVQLSEKANMVAIYRLTREPSYKLEEEARDAGNFDSDVYDENEFREWYLAYQPTDKLWVALGKQQVVWGDLSGIGLRVMDNINALDVRWHYALDNLEDVRKPLIMSNIIYSIPSWEANVQVVWVPGLEDTWERVNSVYANPGHRYGLNNLSPAGTVDPTGRVSPGRDDPSWFAYGIPEDDEADPNGIDRDLSDSMIGGRYQQTSFSGALTWAVSALWTHNANPSVWVDAAGLNIEYLRQAIFGVTANYYDQFTDGVFLFEAGYFPDSPFTGNAFELVEEDVWKWGLRYNRNTFFYWLPNGDRRSVSSGFQVLQTVIPDNDDIDLTDDTGLGGEKTDTVGTIFLNWGVANDRLQFNANWNHWFEREFGVLLLWADYRPQILNGDFLITPKWIFMYGDTAYSGDFGLTRGASEILLELTYEF